MAVLKFLNPETGEWTTVAGGGSSIATGPEEPTGAKFWIDTDDEGGEGGGGASTADKITISDETATSLGLESGATVDEALAQVNAAKTPDYEYGTEDLTAGTSPLETGKLYFVYE